MTYDQWKTRSPDDENPPPEVLVECEACGGEGITRRGIWVYEHGCGFGHDDVEELPCRACNGSGISHIDDAPGDFR